MRRFLSLVLLILIAPPVSSSVGMYPPQAAIEGEQWETWELIAYLRMSGFEVEIEETARFASELKHRHVRVFRHDNTEIPHQLVRDGLRPELRRLSWGRFLLEGLDADIEEIHKRL